MSDAQGTHYYLLTLQAPLSGGTTISSTFSGTWTPACTTRQALFESIYNEVTRNQPQFVGAIVLFFDIQPNQL